MHMPRCFQPDEPPRSIDAKGNVTDGVPTPVRRTFLLRPYGAQRWLLVDVPDAPLTPPKAPLPQ